jgi:hypothetical protein
MATLAFRTSKSGAHTMRVSYDIGSGEQGEELFRLFRGRPSSLLKVTRAYAAKNGQRFQTGIVLSDDGNGSAVAWPIGTASNLGN